MLLIVLVGGCSPVAQERSVDAVAVRTITVETKAVRRRMSLQGRVSALGAADVRPQIDGIITARLFREGDLVQAGQPLYRIDGESYRALVQGAEARLARAEALTSSTSNMARRYHELARLHAVSEQEAETALMQAEQASAVVDEARASLRSIRLDLDRTIVKSPIAGRAGRSMVSTGALVTASQAASLTTIRKLGQVYVDVPFAALGGGVPDGRTTLEVLRSGRTDVRLLLEDGSHYAHAGELLFAETRISGDTGSRLVRTRFPNPEELLQPGMLVRAEFHLQAGRAIVVPRSAVRIDERGRYEAVLVDDHGRLTVRKVRAERIDGRSFVVSQGLRIGDRIVVSKISRLQSGMSAIVRNRS